MELRCERMDISAAEGLAWELRGLLSFIALIAWCRWRRPLEHQNAQEIEAGLADVRRDDMGGNRITLTAGENPHYVAGLFRGDELAKEKGP
jgi:hypothetical protein